MPQTLQEQIDAALSAENSATTAYLKIRSVDPAIKKQVTINGPLHLDLGRHTLAVDYSDGPDAFLHSAAIYCGHPKVQIHGGYLTGPGQTNDDLVGIRLANAYQEIHGTHVEGFQHTCIAVGSQEPDHYHRTHTFKLVDCYIDQSMFDDDAWKSPGPTRPGRGYNYGIATHYANNGHIIGCQGKAMRHFILVGEGTYYTHVFNCNGETSANVLCLALKKTCRDIDISGCVLKGGVNLGGFQGIRLTNNDIYAMSRFPQPRYCIYGEKGTITNTWDYDIRYNRFHAAGNSKAFMYLHNPDLMVGRMTIYGNRFYSADERLPMYIDRVAHQKYASFKAYWVDNLHNGFPMKKHSN